MAIPIKRRPDSDSKRFHPTHVGVTQDRQRVQLLWVVLGLRSSLFLVELGVGLWSQSLSLLASSGHLFADLVTLGLTLLAAWLVQRQSSGQAILNYQHVAAWVALVNGMSLITIALLITWEAVRHLQAPEPVLGLPMLIVAGLSLVINGWSIYLLHEDRHRDLNVWAVFLHGVADTASSIGLILAALAVYLFGWLWADAVVSLLVALLICLSAISLLRGGWQILGNKAT